MRVFIAHIRRWAFGVVLLVAAAAGLAARQDASLGALAGEVVDDGGRALPGATVRISLITKGDRLERSTETDAAGRFEFRGVPSGRFTLVASLPDYLSAAFAADSPGDSGVPVRLTAGQRLSNVSVTLHKSSAIAGRVLNERSEPCPGTVRAIPAEWRSDGETVETGNDGAYRITNLPAGRYLVVFEPRDSVWRVKNKTGVEHLVVIPRTFYPGITAEAGAVPMMIGPGDEVTGVDIRVSVLPATSIEVTAPAATGGRAHRVQLALLAADGTLTGVQSYTSGSELPRIDGVVAGEYQLIVSGIEGPPTVSDLKWATVRVNVSGSDPLNVSVVLGPAARIEGRTRLDPAAAPGGFGDQMASAWKAFAARKGGVRMAGILPEDSRGRAFTIDRRPPVPVWLKPAAPAPPRGVIAIDGASELFVGDATRFGIRDIAPGRYVIQAGDLDAPPGWALKSATIGGRDVLDLPIVLRADDNLTDVALTLSDRFSSLTGVVTGEDEKPRFDLTLVVFPSASRYWWRGTRRIRTTRPDTAGVYELDDLPAGEYLVATLPMRSVADVNDPDVLTRLAASATNVSIGDAGRNVQDLRIK